MDWFQAQYRAVPKDRDDWRASPLLAKNLKGLPPAYVLVGGHDPLREEGEAYAMARKKAGVPVVFREFAGKVHGFVMLCRAIPQAGQAIAAMRPPPPPTLRQGQPPHTTLTTGKA